MAPWVNWDRLYKSSSKRYGQFSWLTLRALLSSANDVIGRGAPSLVRDQRARWVTRQRGVPSHGRWSDDFVIPLRGAKTFLVLGDPGEQDRSQYAVVPPLVAQENVDFMAICSDVIYPAGDVNDYVDGFYRPYEQLEAPIFALPGNHDWYDGLSGFMWNFCDADALPRDDYLSTTYSTRERLARRLWRRASRPQFDVLNAWRNRSAPEGAAWKPLQPGPYWAIDTGDLMIVAIDTGITGEIDRDQADWLVRMSRTKADGGLPKPKVLLTGKPLVVDHKHKRGEIVAGERAPAPPYEWVDQVVRDPANGYVAAIGGDIHNYQHYQIGLAPPAAPRIDYFVSGGGGAYMSATHPIPEPARPHAFAGGQLDDFTAYPSRVDSLHYYSKLFVPRVRHLVLKVVLAQLGLIAAALATLVFDLEDDLLHGILTGAAGFTAAWILLLAAFSRGDRERVDSARRAASAAAALTSGVALGLSGWWLTGERFDEVMLAYGVLTLFGATVARLLRAAGLKWLWNKGWKQGLIYAVQIAGILLVATFVAAPRQARGELWAVVVVVLLLIGVPVVNLVLRWAFRKVLKRDIRGQSLAIGLVLTLGALVLAVLVVDPGDEVRAVETTFGTLAALVALPLALDYARRVSPEGYKPLIALALLAIAAGVVALVVYDVWVIEAAVAAVTLLAVGVLAFATVHLTFLSAFSLLWHWKDDGTLTDDDADRAVRWRDGTLSSLKDRRVRRIANLVHPGIEGPRGPLQDKVSEIFDSDNPPFHKNFLRVEVRADALVVQCIGVTGEETERSPAAVEDEVTIPWPDTVARPRPRLSHRPSRPAARSAPSGS